MVEQTIKAALPISKYAFPDCEGLWLFDNAANHSSYVSDALVAYKMSKKALTMQEAFLKLWSFLIFTQIISFAVKLKE
jgi:hypothetical protein